MKLKPALIITAIFFALHVIEEYLTHFYTTDKLFLWLAESFPTSMTPLKIFTLFQILLWTTMILGYGIVKNSPKMKYFIIAVSTIALFEIHHIYEAIKEQAYYSGLLTALPLVYIGIFLLISIRAFTLSD